MVTKTNEMLLFSGKQMLEEVSGEGEEGKLERSSWQWWEGNQQITIVYISKQQNLGCHQGKGRKGQGGMCSKCVNHTCMWSYIPHVMKTIFVVYVCVCVHARAHSSVYAHVHTHHTPKKKMEKNVLHCILTLKVFSMPYLSQLFILSSVSLKYH